MTDLPITEEILADIEAKAKTATPGEWSWWTSCSWRRLRASDDRSDRPVIEPYVCRDGHPDCIVTEEDMRFIVALQPARALSLVAHIRAQAAEIAKFPTKEAIMAARVIAAETELTAATRRIARLEAALRGLEIATRVVLMEQPK